MTDNNRAGSPSTLSDGRVLFMVVLTDSEWAAIKAMASEVYASADKGFLPGGNFHVTALENHRQTPDSMLATKYAESERENLEKEAERRFLMPSSGTMDSHERRERAADRCKDERLRFVANACRQRETDALAMTSEELAEACVRISAREIAAKYAADTGLIYHTCRKLDSMHEPFFSIDEIIAMSNVDRESVLARYQGTVAACQIGIGE